MAASVGPQEEPCIGCSPCYSLVIYLLTSAAMLMVIPMIYRHDHSRATPGRMINSAVILAVLAIPVGFTSCAGHPNPVHQFASVLLSLAVPALVAVYAVTPETSS